MECRGGHVGRKLLAEALSKRIRIQRFRSGVEGDELLVAHDDRAVAHARQAHERALDLADLDPKAADLDLGIAAAEELELPIGQPAAVVTTSIQAPTWPMGSGRKALRVRSGSLMYPRPTHTPEKTISPASPSGTGASSSSTT